MSSDAIASIRVAAELLQQGLLTDTEFAQLKRQALAAAASAPQHNRPGWLAWLLPPRTPGVAALPAGQGQPQQPKQPTQSKHHAVGRLETLGRHLGAGSSYSAAAAAAAQTPESLRSQRKAADEDGFKRMYEQTLTTSTAPMMTAEQKYLFDMQGFLVIPGVVSPQPPPPTAPHRCLSCYPTAALCSRLLTSPPSAARCDRM